MARVQDWPEKLAEQVALAQDKPYVLGQHDCLRFTCACIQAMTGEDYWPRFAGYTTKRQALKKIATIGGSLGEAVSVVLGRPALPSKLCAQRGDIALYQDENGDHLSVCVGPTVAVLTDTGLGFVRLDNDGVRNAWRIE